MTTEDKALKLLNSVRVERGFEPLPNISRLIDFDEEALCRAIEQHEAFRQEVSDIVYAHVHVTRTDDWEKLKTLIIPKPKPDPLLAAMNEVIKTADVVQANADQLRAALGKLGFEIREKDDD